MQKSISTLAIGGITITSDKLFDLSVIDEVYQEQADLKTAPIPG
jgi:hypothetical protein